MKIQHLVCASLTCALISSVASAQEPVETLPPETGEPVEVSPPSEQAPEPVEVSPSPERTEPVVEVEETIETPDLSAAELAELEASLAADTVPESAANTQPAASSNSNPDISVILDVAGAYFSDEPALTGGHDPNHTGVTLQQLEMHIASSVDPFFTFDANLVFSQFGVEVEEAYFTSLALPGNLQLRGGQFLTNFGRINPTHPHSWSFLNQPLVIGKYFGSEGSRGLGAEVSWLTPLPWYVEVVGSATEGVGDCCARSFFGSDDLGIETPGDLLYTTALKQFFPISDDFSAMWGLSAQFGPNPTGSGNRTEIYGTDLYFRYRPVNATDFEAVSLQIEAMARRRQVPRDVLSDFGGYAHLVWRMNKEWETGLRYEYVTGVAEDYLDADWDEDRTRASAQVTFYPSHFSRLRLQGLADRTDDDRWYWGAILGVEVLVGAHGAHRY